MCHQKAQCTQLPALLSFQQHCVTRNNWSSSILGWERRLRPWVIGPGTSSSPEVGIPSKPHSICGHCKKNEKRNLGKAPQVKCTKQRLDCGPNLPGTRIPHCCPHWWLHQQLTAIGRFFCLRMAVDKSSPFELERERSQFQNKFQQRPTSL